MPHFLLTFGDASRPPVAATIIEAPSMAQARMTAVVRRLASGVPFGEGLNLSAEMMTSMPPEQIGRMMSGLEAAELIPSARPRSRKAGAMNGRRFPRPVIEHASQQCPGAASRGPRDFPRSVVIRYEWFRH